MSLGYFRIQPIQLTQLLLLQTKKADHTHKPHLLTISVVAYIQSFLWLIYSPSCCGSYKVIFVVVHIQSILLWLIYNPFCCGVYIVLFVVAHIQSFLLWLIHSSHCCGSYKSFLLWLMYSPPCCGSYTFIIVVAHIQSFLLAPLSIRLVMAHIHIVLLYVTQTPSFFMCLI